jgi:hypothetical protein
MFCGQGNRNHQQGEKNTKPQKCKTKVEMEMDKVAKQATNKWNQACHSKNHSSNNEQKG